MAGQHSRRRAVQLTYMIEDEVCRILERVDVSVGYIHGDECQGVLPKLVEALEGREGKETTVKVSAAEGFGERRPELCITQPLQGVPPESRRIGAKAKLENDKGEQITLIVPEIKDNKGALKNSEVPPIHGCIGLAQRLQAVELGSKVKTTLFALRGLRTPGWSYSDLP